MKHPSAIHDKGNSRTTRGLWVIISPVDRSSAVLTQSDLSTLTKHSMVSADHFNMLIGDYFSRYPVSTIVHIDDEHDAHASLARATEQASTLDFILMMLDPQHSVSLKQIAGERLEDLLRNTDNYTYALDILLSHPVPNDINLKDAIDLTKQEGPTHRFLYQLIHSQDRVRFACEAWVSLRNHSLLRGRDISLEQGRLMRSGVWRRAITEIHTASIMREQAVPLLLSTQNAISPRIAKEFLDAYARLLPLGIQRLTAASSTPEDFPTEESDAGDRPRPLPSRQNADYEQRRAVLEVTAIAQAYCDGKDETARQYLTELIQRQSVASDHSHLVKSLCNIASRCDTNGRDDAALECLNKAVTFEQGVDARLFVQLGTRFRDLRQYERSAHCYKKALSLVGSDWSEHNNINRELARLLIARGYYQDALTSFLSLSDITSSPESRASLATLLRKMGRWGESRREYESVWSDFRTHTAYAGLAEVHRHTGRLDKSIRKYHQILRHLDVDEGSRKVYQLSLSSLHMSQGQLLESRRILDSLYSNYPHDASIGLAMAKLHRLLGDFNTADDFYRRSRRRIHTAEQLAARLYETASASIVGNIDGDYSPEDTLGENSALSFCNATLRRIISGKIDNQGRILPPAGVIYRLHSDFGEVLSYHVNVFLGHTHSRTDNATINRIRKRGHQDLRLAVLALDQRQFEYAIEVERRICLKIA